jgi:hypothetical protein
MLRYARTDEHLAVGEFESRHIFGDWYLASTKLESAWIYALIVDSDELGELQALVSDAKDRDFNYRPLDRYLRKLEKRHVACPSVQQPPVSQTRFFRKFPNEDVTVTLSPFVVIRCMDRLHRQGMLAVNYVNGRFVRLPSRERAQLRALAKEPMSVTVSMKPLRRKLEKLHRFAVITCSGGLQAH